MPQTAMDNYNIPPAPQRGGKLKPNQQYLLRSAIPLLCLKVQSDQPASASPTAEIWNR